MNFNRGSDDRSSKERIIPIAMEKKMENGKPDVQSPPTKPPVARPFQSQKSNISQGYLINKKKIKLQYFLILKYTGPIAFQGNQRRIPIRRPRRRANQSKSPPGST